MLTTLQNSSPVLYEDKEYLDHTAQECYRVTQNPAFRWDKIAEGFEKAIEEVCK